MKKKLEELNADRKHVENLPGAVLPDNVKTYMQPGCCNGKS